MNSKLQLYLALATGTLLIAAQASADPKFSHSSDEDLSALQKATETEWKAGAQAGLIFTTGNASVATMSMGAKASRKAAQNKLQLEVAGAYVRSSILLANDADQDGDIGPGEFERQTKTTAKSWETKARYDRFLSATDALYLSGLASANEPAGKEFVGGGQLGYSRTAFASNKHEIVAEAGYDLSYEKPVVGQGFDNHSLRAFVGYQAKVGKETGLDVSVEGLFNLNTLDTPTGTATLFEDARINSKLALTTKLFEDISFRFGVAAKYDNVPSPLGAFATPYEDGFVPAADKLDTITEATLIVNFL